jgi:pimeloyl-ACP methyl ester carboxylesterase
LIRLLDEAVAAGVVTEVLYAVGQYRFAHSLVHETLRSELTSTRRVRLHGQTLQYADSNGVKLAFEVLGSRGPLLIAAGVSNCPAVRTRMSGMARHWDRVARFCRPILYDRRGVGYSAAPDRGYSLLAAVEDLRAVLDAAGAERSFIWGLADGGPLAIALAATYPDRVAGLLLTGTSAKYMNTDDFAYGVNPTVLESFFRAEAVDSSRAVSELVSHARPGQLGAGDIAEVMARVPPRVWSKLVLGIGAADARALLADIRAPTLIVHDPESAYMPVGAARYLHERILGSRLEISGEYGIMPYGESVYQTIEAFMEEAISLRQPG